MFVTLTEAEWRVSNDPNAMLRVLKGNPCASERKLRLFAYTSAELAIARLSNRADFLPILATAKNLVEGLAQPDEVRLAAEEAIALEVASTTRANARVTAAVSCTLEREAYRGACGVVGDLLHNELEGIVQAKPELHANLLRCMFGIPYRGFDVGFRLLRLNPAWRTLDAVVLARGIYDDRAFDRMPILADALQDAGCDNDDILNHCRDTSTPHARGCWVVDLLLGKE